MSSAHQAGSESSVLFNLRELMELETQRVAAERQAALARREASERAERERERAQLAAAEASERERQAQLRRAQAEAEAAQRAEIERSAALLRARLDAEAAERSRREQQSGQQVRLTGALRRARRQLALLLTAAAISGTIAAAGLGRMRGELSTSRSQASGAQRIIAAQQRALAELRERLTAPRSDPAPGPAAAPNPSRPAPRSPQTTTPPVAARPGRKASPVLRHAPQPAPVDADCAADDPLCGL